MTENKRIITPYKGGRSKRFECRIHPDIKEKLKEIAQRENVTPADLIEKWILQNITKKQ